MTCDGLESTAPRGAGRPDLLDRRFEHVQANLLDARFDRPSSENVLVGRKEDGELLEHVQSGDFGALLVDDSPPDRLVAGNRIRAYSQALARIDLEVAVGGTAGESRSSR